MSKQRTPDTIEDTVHMVIGLLGQARCCEVTGRKPTLLKAWANPDDDQRSISLHACIALDRELLRLGHPPLLSQFHSAAVAPVQIEAPTLDATPLDHAMRVVGESADMLEETAAALKNDGVIDAAEAMRISSRIASVMQSLGQAKRSLFQKPKAAGARARTR